MTTRMTPGRFRKDSRPHSVPESVSTGMTGRPVREAKAATPGCSGNSTPGGARVPSGKMTICRPSFTACSAWRTIDRIVAPPPSRSMAIMPVASSSLPNSGMRSNSCFRTKQKRGASVGHSSVSNADSWRDAISAGPAGRLSSPSIWIRMRQIRRRLASTKRVQNRASGITPAGEISRTTVAGSTIRKVEP